MAGLDYRICEFFCVDFLDWILMMNLGDTYHIFVVYCEVENKLCFGPPDNSRDAVHSMTSGVSRPLLPFLSCIDVFWKVLQVIVIDKSK